MAEETRQPGINPLTFLLQVGGQANLLDIIGDSALVTKLGEDVVRFTAIDNRSREDWTKRSEFAMDLALQIVEEKQSPWPGASNVKYPLISVAALQFHARSYPAIVTGDRVVKGKVTGNDPGEQKLKHANRIASHMNWQLLEENESWEEELDKLLLALPVEGCEFKKSYFDPKLGYNVSEWVRPADFIVNNATKCLSTCPRMTHILRRYPYQIDELMLEGTWSDVDLNLSPDELEEEVLQEFYEQHFYYDFNQDGKKEPYIATVHVNSRKVVRIAPGFYPEEIVINVNGQQGTIKEMGQAVSEEEFAQGLQQAALIRVPRVEMFTKFGFLPSPDGSFYDIGFGQLIGPISDSVDTTINQLLDAGTLSNLQCGFIAEGVSVNGKRGDVRFSPGEFKTVKLPSNMQMNNAVYQIKFNEPSLVLFQLLGMLVQSAKDITSVQDIMTGGPQQPGQAATTSMIQIEQGLQVFSSIYKRIYRCLKKEFKILYKLNGKFMQPEQYFNVVDTQEVMVAGLADYQNDGTNVQPVADPQLATNMLAMAKNQALLGIMSHPIINDENILTRYVNALDIPNPESVFIPPDQRQAPPDPELVLKAQIAASEHAVRMAEIAEKYSKAIDNLASAEAREVGPQLQLYADTLKAMLSTYGGNNANQAFQGAGTGVALPPGNGGAV